MARIIVITSLVSMFLSLFITTVLSNISFLPVMPDLVLLVIVYVGFMNTSIIGSTTGFISGLLLDFISAAPIGLNALTKCITGFIAGRFSRSVNLDRVFLPALFGFSATVIKFILTAIVSLFFNTTIFTYKLNSPVLWLELLINTICAPIIFSLLSAFLSVFSDSREIR